MTLIAGNDLNPDRFFSTGSPIVRGSSFDLTVGAVYDHAGRKIEKPFTLEPGHMVQVVSAEVFSLPKNVTGHVIYKTALTKIGIWALTVGIVDPGWSGPVTTSLLNFSKAPYVISLGMPFLRVSFFEHKAVSASCIPAPVSLQEYFEDAREKAQTRFPETFLNQSEISEKAKNATLDGIKTNVLIWLPLFALMFAAFQFVMNAPTRSGTLQANDEFHHLQSEVSDLQKERVQITELRDRVDVLERAAQIRASSPPRE